MTKPWPLQKDCSSYYGNPTGANGQASAAWKKENLVMVSAPWQLVAAWDTKLKLKIQVHRKCAESLKRVLDAIWERFGRSEAEIRKARMHLFGGGFNYRLKRGGSTLSMHSWGCAVDFDPERNAMGDATPAMDRRVVEEFEREGWEWGGHWKDGMHFQAAWTRAKPPRLKAANKPTAGANPPGTKPQDDPKSADLSPPPIADRDVIQRQQEYLTNLKYHTGGADGIVGPLTKSAIRDFRADHGMPPLPPNEEYFDAPLVLAIQAATEARKLVPERANATPEVVREKVPEAAAANEARREAEKGKEAAGTVKTVVGGGGILASLWAFLDGIVGKLPDADAWLTPVKALFSSVPGWGWGLIAVAVAALLWFIFNRVQESAGAAEQAAGAAEEHAGDAFREAKRL